MSNMLPRGTLNPIMRRYVTDMIDLKSQTTLPVGGHMEWSYRPLLFDATTRSAGDQLQCRPLGLDGYANVKTLTLTPPQMALGMRGMRMRGVRTR